LIDNAKYHDHFNKDLTEQNCRFGLPIPNLTTTSRVIEEQLYGKQLQSPKH